MIDKVKDILRPIYRPVKNHIILKKADKAASHYQEVIGNIRNSGKKKIRFAAYVIFDSTFGMDGVFKLMMKVPEKWEPKIVVIPDIFRGLEHQKETYKKTRDYFINKYGSDYVLDGWDMDRNEYFDHLDKFDIVYYANPYDNLVHKYHSIVYASTKNVLPVYVSYGYDIGYFTTISRLKSPELNLMWKLFADTTYTYQDYVEYQLVKGRNVTLAGYSKMDNLSNFPSVRNDRKKFLITPHHTVSFDVLPLSNFLEYSDLILRLPQIFPEADFVFRPHPLLFTTLKNNGVWTPEKVEEYLSELKSAGITYSSGGDYLAIFAECDAIVNDCGSFTVEWLYTGKPGCFVYNRNLREEHMTTLMNKAIYDYTIARSEDDIINFIRSIIDADAPVEYQMKDWVRENVALNYPDVSSFILSELNILDVDKRNE